MGGQSTVFSLIRSENRLLMTRHWLFKRAGLNALAVLLLLLAGCATTGKVVEPLPARERPIAIEGPTVTRLENGREGFMIKETPTMDSESRSDFTEALGLMEEGEYEKAVELLDKVIERSPGVTAPYINRAMACRQTGEKDRAEDSLKKALELVPEHPVASNEYGLLLRQGGRFDEARTIYEKALETFPEYFPVRKNLGILCDLYLNDQTCALEHYEIYSKAKPDDEQVKIWIADLRLRLGL